MLMYNYVVHIEREHLDQWQIAVPDPMRGRDSIINYYQSGTVKIDYSLGGKGEAEAETWYCQTKAAAEMLAMKLAKDRPNRAIYIMETIAMAQATSNDPIISQVSQKGVLPK
jgi:hypothetical protein